MPDGTSGGAAHYIRIVEGSESVLLGLDQISQLESVQLDGREELERPTFLGIVGHRGLLFVWLYFKVGFDFVQKVIVVVIVQVLVLDSDQWYV